MIRQSGETYQSSDFLQALNVSEAKVGKTSFLAASCLGVLPWQKAGGLISRPENLHIFAFDANSLGGLNKFLTQTCGAPAEALRYNVYNFQEDVRSVSRGQEAYDYGLYNMVQAAIEEVRTVAAKGGVHAVMFSSLTGLAEALHRAVAGPPGGDTGEKKGRGMDISKWDTFAGWLTEIRNFAQAGHWHTLWEAHIYKAAAIVQDKNAPPPKESLQLQGKSAYNFPMNVEQIFRIRRQFGQKFGQSACDQVYLDTAPALDFVVGGRSFTESLASKEYDLALAAKKLGLKIGAWGAKAAPVRAVKGVK